MDNITPWDVFDPTSPESLVRKHEMGIPILNEDLAIVVEANPDVVTVPLLREYLLRGLRGELKKPAGRKALGAARTLRLEYASMCVEILTKWYKRAARRGYSYALKKDDGALSTQIHELVARRLKMGSGASLANALSAHKKQWVV